MQDNRFSILKNAQKLFQQYGYSKTTLTDIAKSLGKVKTAIYYYFGGKEEIFEELVRLEAKEFYENLKAVVEIQKDPLEGLKTYVDTRIELMGIIAKRYHFLKKEFFELMPIVEKNREEYYQMEIILITELIESGRRDGIFKLESSQLSAVTLVNILKGLEIQMFVTDKIMLDRANIENIRNSILFGIIQPTKS